MKIIALYKTFSGEEWLEASVRSIYKHVFKIVLVNSNMSWTGIKGNQCIPVIKKLKDCYDPDNKIHSITYNTINQLDQCMVGYNYIKKTFPCNFVQLIDADEVWDDENYNIAKRYLEKNPRKKAYRTRMYTYVKSPFYRVAPIEGLKPVCFVNPDLPNLSDNARGCGLIPWDLIECKFHHFVFVRESFNKVLSKIVTSHTSENQAFRQMDEWITDVWNKLPEPPMDFHPALGFGSNWKTIEVIDESKLPEILRAIKFNIVEMYR